MHTLALFKPRSVDTCRGCVVATYSDEFGFHYQIDDEELIGYAADALARPLGTNEVGFTVLVHLWHPDGMSVLELEVKNGEIVSQHRTPTGEDVGRRLALLEKQICDRFAGIREQQILKAAEEAASLRVKHAQPREGQ